jgi:hypothetical protein
MELIENTARLAGLDLATIRSILPGLMDESKCRQAILDYLHPRGMVCPSCGCAIDGRAAAALYAGKRSRCRACNKFFNALTATPLAGLHMSYAEIMLMLSLFGIGAGNHEIAAVLGDSPDAIRIRRTRIYGAAPGDNSDSGEASIAR